MQPVGKKPVVPEDPDEEIPLDKVKMKFNQASASLKKNRAVSKKFIASDSDEDSDDTDGDALVRSDYDSDAPPGEGEDGFVSSEDNNEEVDITVSNYSAEDIKWCFKGEGEHRMPEGKFNGHTWTPGLKNRNPKAVPIELFREFFPKKSMEAWVVWTNKWADKYHASRRHSWKALTYGELLIFLGLLISMTVVRYKVLDDYWRKGEEGAVVYPDFGRFGLLITRWKKIWRALHFNDPDKEKHFSEPGCDRLHKLRPVIDDLNSGALRTYVMGRSVSADEAMIAFQGRSYFKQYMPKKICKWGFKVMN